MNNHIITDKKIQKLIIFSISFASFMVNLDTYIVNISLPSISSYFNIDSGEVSWVALSYNLTVASLLIIFGKLGDRLGLKKVFIAGLSVFTISSFMCGMSSSLYWLIAGRFLQGIGASVLYAMTPAMIPKYLPENLRGPAFGTLATSAALGIIIGTPLGGLITGYLSWQWIFYINIIPGILAVIICSYIIPADIKVTVNESFDFIGALLSFIFSLAFIYGLNIGQEKGWTSLIVMSCFSIAVIFLAIFILWEYKNPHPLVELSFFRNMNFNCGNIASFLASNFLSGHNFLMPFYLTIGMKLPPQEAGIIYMVYSGVYMFVGPLTGKYATVSNSERLSAIAMFSGALSTLVFAFLLPSKSFIYIIIYFIILGITYGIFITANNNIVIGMAPEGKQGIISGIFRMTGRLGMASGVCIFETVFSSQLHVINHKIDYSSISNDILINGFHIAYLAGAIVLMITGLFSIIPKIKKRCEK